MPAGIRKNKKLAEEIARQHFTVAIFGSARIRSNDPVYKQIVRLAKTIGAAGHDVVTGGGPGIMDAANLGHQEGRRGSKAHSLGLNIKLPWEQKANKHLDIEKDFERFSDRLDAFMLLANVVVVAPGGIGTLLELFYTWQLTQVRHIDDIPIILFGEMWPELLGWIRLRPLRHKLISPADFDNIFLVSKVNEVSSIIAGAYQAFASGKKHSCRELKKKMGYSLEKRIK